MKLTKKQNEIIDFIENSYKNKLIIRPKQV